MEDWQLEPARDLGASGMDRYRMPQRESGLVESVARLFWWLLLRLTFRVWNRLSVVGREHLPKEPSLVLVANHASHLDALLLTTLLPLRWRDQTFPIAARDIFFERYSLAAFSAMFVNSLPIFRGASGRHGLAEIRDRLLSEPCIMILFPEGTRTRSGESGRFKPGVGMLVAGTPIPVVPCYIEGAFEAMPPNRWLLRPRRITIRLGPPQVFADIENKRPGWDLCAQRLQEAIHALSPSGPLQRRQQEK